MLFAEVYAPKLDADKKPVKGGDGHFVPDKLVGYTAMEREAGWGDDVPEMLRNADWSYAVFTADKQHRAGVNQGPCFACHKPLEKTSYLFTLKELASAAPRQRVAALNAGAPRNCHNCSPRSSRGCE